MQEQENNHRKELRMYDDNEIYRSYSVKHQDGCWVVGEIPETDWRAIQLDSGKKDYVKERELSW